MPTNECKLNEYQCSERKSGSLRKYWLVVLFFVIMFLPIFLFLLWFSMHFEYDEGYDSPEKLMCVYQQYKSDFQNAMQVFTQLPTHEQKNLESDYKETIIRRADRFETSNLSANENKLIQQTYKTLLISSTIHYSDIECEQIYLAANPLMQNLEIDRIMIWPDSKEIYFVIFDDNREFVGHADVIAYDPNTEILEGNDLRDYIATYVSQRQPVELEIIEKGWIAFSQGET